MCRSHMLHSSPAVAVHMLEVIRSVLLNSCQPKVLTRQGELMNHVKRLRFQTWPPAGGKCQRGCDGALIRVAPRLTLLPTALANRLL